MPRVVLSVGRQRVTRASAPWESGYTRSINASMKQIIRNMEKIITAINATSVPALKYAVRPIYDTSQELVPVDTGRLKRSGYIVVARSSKGLRVEVGYAKGGNPRYAVLVHEKMDAPHEPPTQAKFLEEAVNRHVGNISSRYASYVKREVGL